MNLRVLIFEEPALMKGLADHIQSVDQFSFEPVFAFDEEEGLAALADADMAIIRVENGGDKAGVRIACAAINERGLPVVVIGSDLDDDHASSLDSDMLHVMDVPAGPLDGISRVKLRLAIIWIASMADHIKSRRLAAA